MSKFLSTVATAALFLAPSAGAQTLATAIGANNNQNGIMFDVQTGGSALTFQSIAANVNSGSYNFEFWTRDGTVVDHDQDSAGWTLRNVFSNVAGAGLDQLTSFDISDFLVNANSTLGIYLTGTGGYPMNYTNGSHVGDVIASDANLSILTGYGKDYQFASTFQPRNFNGSISYATGAAAGAVPEPAAWGMFILGFGAIGGTMRVRARKVAFA
jgi:hypothetical protein